MASLGSAVPLILQGVVMTVLGLLVYQTGHRWFSALGSDTFDSKEVAQVTVVGFLLISGFLGEPLLKAVQNLTLGLDSYQQWGLVIGSSRVLVNAIVPNWSMTDKKSLVVYALAIGLFIAGGQ